MQIGCEREEIEGRKAREAQNEYKVKGNIYIYVLR